MRKKYNKILYILIIFSFVITNSIPQVVNASIQNVLHKQVKEQEVRKGLPIP